MDQNINIEFNINILEDKIYRTKLTEENKKIVKHKDPFLLVGFSNNIYIDCLLFISLSKEEQDEKIKYSIKSINLSKKIDKDSKLIIYVCSYVENDDGFPIPQRISQKYIYLYDLLEEKRTSLIFLEFQNKLKEKVLTLELDIKGINYTSDLFINTYTIDYIKKQEKKREEEVKLFCQRSDINRNFIFTNYQENTKRMVFNRSFDFFEFGFCFTYINVNIGKTNEEFWENLLYISICNVWIETGKNFEIENKEVIKDEESFKRMMHKIYFLFTLKEKLSVLSEMLCLISVNSVYMNDFSTNYKGEKISIEDFFEIDGGYGDCDDLDKYIIVCKKYFESISSLKNEILSFLQKITQYYIPFLSLASVFSDSGNNFKKGKQPLCAHLTSPWILKSWLFEKGNSKVEQNTIGKILPNFFSKKKINEEIDKNLNLIIEDERKKGNLIKNINNENLPTLLIFDGTGSFLPHGGSIPLTKEYQSMDKIFQENDKLFEVLMTKISGDVNDSDNIFYQNFHVLITDFFLFHPKFPTNIPKFLLSNRFRKKKEDNEEEEEPNFEDYEHGEIIQVYDNYKIKKIEFGFYYGVSYKDLMEGKSNILFICDIPLIPFKTCIEMSNTISKDQLKTQDLVLLENNEDRIKFKDRYKSMDKNMNLIKSPSELPMLDLNVILDLDKRILNNINILMGKNFNSLKETEYYTLNKKLSKVYDKKILLYSLKLYDMLRYVDSFFQYIEKENIKMISVKRIDINSLLSSYRIFLEFK